jgi:uncharacterized protein YndB with AHSA1/START domain
MSKKKSKNPVKKSPQKPALATKAVKKPANGKPAPKKPVKPVAKKAAPVKKTEKPAAATKPAPKSVKKAIPAKKAETPKSTPVVAAKTVKKEDVKVKSAPVKTVPAKDTKPAAPAAPASKGKKAVEPPPPPPPSNLPKLPKGFVLKKQKGKLAPGEKRVFKTNVITHHVISEVPLEENERKGKPEPKGKFNLEYIIHTPVTLLYDFLTTPNGLAEWFADGVDLKNDIYTFDWDGQKQNARIISAKIDNHIRMRWLDKPDGTYFEFRLNQDELTNEVSLNITDFGDGDDDIMTSRRLWDSQIHRLVKALGTY